MWFSFLFAFYSLSFIVQCCRQVCTIIRDNCNSSWLWVLPHTVEWVIIIHYFLIENNLAIFVHHQLLNIARKRFILAIMICFCIDIVWFAKVADNETHWMRHLKGAHVSNVIWPVLRVIFGHYKLIEDMSKDDFYMILITVNCFENEIINQTIYKCIFISLDIANWHWKQFDYALLYEFYLFVFIVSWFMRKWWIEFFNLKDVIYWCRKMCSSHILKVD